MGEPLLIDRPLDGVVRLRLNRPERANALDTALVDALHDAFSGLDASSARSCLRVKVAQQGETLAPYLMDLPDGPLGTSSIRHDR